MDFLGLYSESGVKNLEPSQQAPNHLGKHRDLLVLPGPAEPRLDSGPSGAFSSTACVSFDPGRAGVQDAFGRAPFLCGGIFGLQQHVTL